MTATKSQTTWHVSKHATPESHPQFGIHADGPDFAIVKGPRELAELMAAAPEMREALKAPKLDAAHDALSATLESENSTNDDVREAAIEMCAALIGYYEQRRSLLSRLA